MKNPAANRVRLAMRALLLIAALGGCKNVTGGRAPEGAIGAGCAADEACVDVEEAPTCLKMPGGYCSAECGGGAFDCDSESICEALGDQAFYCLDGCLVGNGHADCREAYRCAFRPDVINLDGAEVGVCLPRCEQDADCETGTRCAEDGDCVPRGEKVAGASCRRSAECNGGLCLTSAAFRGGYCSARCDSQFAECEQGSFCTDLEGRAVCLAGCDADGDCRGAEGYKCRAVATRRDADGVEVALSACVPRCESDAACGEGRHCDPESGDCAAGAGAPNPIGAFCASHDECASGRCLTGEGFRNGYCSASCRDCEGGVCGVARGGEACLATCAADLDCRPGYVCVGGGCAPPCTDDEDCADGEVCGLATGRCAAPATGDSTLTRVALGAVQVGETLSDEVELEIPAGTLGFAILAEGSGDDLMVVGELRDPAGRKVYDFEDPFASEVRFFPNADSIAQLVPTSPRVTPTPGTWRFRLIKEGGARAIDVSALIKTADGEPRGATLDVNLFFASLEDGPSARGAASDAELQEALSLMRGLLKAQGWTTATFLRTTPSGSR